MDALDCYVCFWSERDPLARARLLAACWSEDSEIVGPGYRFKGSEQVLNEANRFFREQPGWRAVRTSEFDRHGRWARFTIAIVDERGHQAHEGWDVVELGSDGRIHRVITFWGRLEPAK